VSVAESAHAKAAELIEQLAAAGQDRQALRTIYQLGVEVGRIEARGTDIDDVPFFLRRQAQ